VLSAKEKKNTAYHEAGHVIVGRFLPHADPVHKVTIIPRGPALGVTSMIPIEDRYSYAKEYCLAALRMMMGGRAAEEVMFGQFSSGASGDLKSATELAHRMVCQWGMSEMGPISFGSNAEVFLGRDFMRERDFSEETASAIDKAIHKLLEEAYGDAKKMLVEHKNILIALSEELFERETLDADEIDDLIRKHGGAHLLPAKKETPPGTPPKGIEIAPDKVPAPEPEIGGGLGPGDMIPGPA
jgi:cell division protease FtsH